MSESGSSFRVPPYAITGGRTRSQVELAIESLLNTTEKGNAAKLSHEKAQIIELCKTDVISVAEVSAHMKIPLQVVKILAGDLITDGYISTGDTSSSSESKTEERPDLQLLNRVLDGLQSL